MTQNQIPAAAIQPPGGRALALLSRDGHLDRMLDATATWRIPIRLTAESMQGTPEEVARALSVLRNIAPRSEWFAAQAHPGGGIWIAWHVELVATPSRDPSIPPLHRISSGPRWLIVDELPSGLVRLPRGMHEIEQPQRTLLTGP